MTLPPNTLTTRELCRRLNVTPSAISRMVKRGALEPLYQLPGTRGAFMFSEDAVAELERAR